MLTPLQGGVKQIEFNYRCYANALVGYYVVVFF